VDFCMNRPLLLADREGESDALVKYLQLLRYGILRSRTLPETGALLRSADPAILLFWDNLAGEDSLLFLRKLRRMMEIPIILLSPREELSYHLGAYTAGVDDCIRIPVPPRLAVLKIQAVIRRSFPPAAQTALRRPGPETLSAGNPGLCSGGSAMSVPELPEETSRKDVPELTFRESQLLGYLAGRKNQVVSRRQIMALCFPGSDPDSRVVDNHIKNIRSKLADPRSIQTVRGIGYCFQSERVEV